jgi:hypothetical protein
MKFNSSLLEHYLISTIVAGVAIWQTGDHHIKHVIVAAAVGVLAPVISAAYNHVKSINAAFVAVSAAAKTLPPASGTTVSI